MLKVKMKFIAYLHVVHTIKPHYIKMKMKKNVIVNVLLKIIIKYLYLKINVCLNALQVIHQMKIIYVF